MNRRIATVDLHAGMVGAGLVADCRQLGNRARDEAAQHRETFEAEIPAIVRFTRFYSFNLLGIGVGGKTGLVHASLYPLL